MEPIIVSALLVGLISGFAVLDGLGPQLGLWFPIVAGSLVGVALGDVHTALILSAALQLAFIGTVAIGGALPPNPTQGTIVGVALGILGGNHGVTSALALGLPAAVLYQQIDLGMNTVLVTLMHKADRLAELGGLRGIRRLHLIGTALYFLEGFVPIFLVVEFGASPVRHLVNNIPLWLSNGMQVAAGVLPAVGFAMLLRVIWTRSLAGFFIVGFGVASYLKVPVLGAAIIGIGLIMMIAIAAQDRDKPSGGLVSSHKDDALHDRARLPEQRSIFFRHCLFQTSINFERLQGLGFAYAISPVLKRLYRTPEQMQPALERHLVFFNTNPLTGALIVGATASLEEDVAAERAPAETVTAFKASFMGPLAGIGDSIFFFTLYPIAASLGAAFATKGNIFGPILTLLVFNAVALPFKYFGIGYGYRLGARFLSRVDSDALRQLMARALQFAAFVLGALIASLVLLHTSIVVKTEGTKVNIQKILDGIVPDLLPLLITLLAFWLLRRRVPPALLIVIYLVAAVGLTAAKVVSP